MPRFHNVIANLSARIDRAGTIVAVLLASTSLAFAADTQTTELHAGTTTLRLVGDETTLQLISSPTADGKVSVTTSNSMGCILSAKVDQTDDEVVVTLTKSGYTARWWCDPSLTLVVPPKMNLSVELDGMVADIKGDFAAIDIASSKSVINFVGGASRFHLTGAAAITRLSFAPGIKREDVDVSVPMMLSQVSFSDN